MIYFDLECKNKHRFEGIFPNYEAFSDQLDKNMITCPVCQDTEIKRLYTGGSIVAGGSAPKSEQPLPRLNSSFLEMAKKVRDYVEKNFDNVGKDFADTARAIHYGVEEERNIYGEFTINEIKELVDEGVNVLPLPSENADKSVN